MSGVWRVGVAGPQLSSTVRPLCISGEFLSRSLLVSEKCLVGLRPVVNCDSGATNHPGGRLPPAVFFGVGRVVGSAGRPRRARTRSGLSPLDAPRRRGAPSRAASAASGRRLSGRPPRPRGGRASRRPGTSGLSRPGALRRPGPPWSLARSVDTPVRTSRSSASSAVRPIGPCAVGPVLGACRSKRAPRSGPAWSLARPKLAF